jgi:hypothetical protein
MGWDTFPVAFRYSQARFDGVIRIEGKMLHPWNRLGGPVGPFCATVSGDGSDYGYGNGDPSRPMLFSI